MKKQKCRIPVPILFERWFLYLDCFQGVRMKQAYTDSEPVYQPGQYAVSKDRLLLG
jgi:hypothetical protein